MPAIGITGGVATGKSSFTRALLGSIEADHFDADRCVHDLLENDRSLQAEIAHEFGPEFIAPSGGVDRVKMRERAFADDHARQNLEALIHPRVRDQWRTKLELVLQSGRILFLDIPLLYETGSENDCARILVIACSPSVQRRRMAENRGLASELIERMIGSQLDLTAKVSRADHVIWNDGLPAALDEQARLFAAYLRDLYG